MTEVLTSTGYQHTKEKLTKLEQRLVRLERKAGVSSQHVIEARRSYVQMINQYRRELKLYEASHPEVVVQQ